MLKALYDYATHEGLVIPPGFDKKIIKAYIRLSSKGEFIGIEPGDGEAVLCPDIGSLAQGADKCNISAEKVSVLLPSEISKKLQFFIDVLNDSPFENYHLVAAALSDTLLRDQIRSEVETQHLKPSDRISFKIAGKPLTDEVGLADWWDSYRKKFTKISQKTSSLCLITGHPTVPLSTVPPVIGLQSVGGHARGDKLICFDKDSFCSYGLKQSANAPVSEEAFSAVKIALDHLLTDAPQLAGMKFVHWYDRSIPAEDDVLQTVLNLYDSDNPDDEEEDEEDEPLTFNQIIERSKADSVVKSAFTGQQIPALDNIYHILLLTGVNGRVMVRRYENGRYEELKRHFDQWYSDLALINDYGSGSIIPFKLSTRFSRLLSMQKSKQKSNKKLSDRLSKELSGIVPTVLSAIIHGTPLPDSVAVRALSFIRSKMLENDESPNNTRLPDGIACQWLKVWLLRNTLTKENDLMEYYNEKHPEPAYHCGALVSLFAKIQEDASGGVNTGIVQRYYASASRTPALVIGKLTELSNFHLNNLKPGIAYCHSQRLNKLFVALGDHIPDILDLRGQSYFALGYRQYAAQMVAESKAASAAKKELLNHITVKEEN